MKVKKPGRLVCGIGINDSDYTVQTEVVISGPGEKRKRKVTWRCPFYACWVSMIQRCYARKNSKNIDKYINYSTCSVCEEWLTFSNFKAWMEQQDWENKELDKDLLTEANKVYSPNTCIFIESDLNVFLCTRAKLRGDFPIGVSYCPKRNKYESKISYEGKTLHMGRYNCPMKAHKEWIKVKISIAKELLLLYNCHKIRQGLNRVITKLEHHLENNLEVKSL